MSKRIDITEQRFTRLVAKKYEKESRKWICLCDCGKEVPVLLSNLKRSKQKSCGCFNTDRIKHHGQSSRTFVTKEYRAWKNMKNRCLQTSHADYPIYGGRGIAVCERWLNSFENFYADMGDKPSQQHSLDRIDPNGGYEPSNCRWATGSEQIINQRIRSDNTSGCKGVSWQSSMNKWFAYIKPNKEQKRINLGYFDNLEDAITARKQAELTYFTR